MSKFVSHKPGEVINGDGSKSVATIFVDEQGNESAVPTGSPIEKLLLEEMGEVAETAPVVPTPPPVDNEHVAEGAEKFDESEKAVTSETVVEGATGEQAKI